MVRRKVDLLVSITVIAACIRSNHGYYNYQHEPNYDDTSNRDISVQFPKYNIKIASSSVREEPQDVYEQMSSGFDGYNEVEEQEPIIPVSENMWNNYEIPHQNQPIYLPEPEEQSSIYQLVPEPEEQPPIYQLVPELYYPIITREPIETKKPCIHKYLPPYSYLRSAEDYNPEVGRPRSHKKTNDYFVPMWNTNSNTNMNILRAADPRSIIASHTHFVKIKKPVFGTNKVMFSHSKKIIGDDHHGHFGGHFGGSTNIHKNTHIHVHNRNADNPTERQANNNDKIIGSHLFAAPRWRRDTLTRKKRGIVDLAKLVADHRTRLDWQKTSENVGAATRNVFEEDYSPVFHLTNAVGAARDSMYSLMNVRPSGILFPCRYRIVHANDPPSVSSSSPIVGGINPAIYNLHDQSPPPPLPEDGSDYLPPEDEFHPSESSDNNYGNQYSDYGGNGDPLQMIGDKLRESVQWAQRSAGHMADALHHTRKMFVTARRSWPKLLLPYAGAIEVMKPKIGGENADIVGTARDPEYVGVGKMMDYLGMTDRKPDLTPRVGGPRMITEEEMILKKAKETLGAPTYRHFLAEMKRHLDIGSSAKNEIVGRARLIPSPGNAQTRLALDRLRHAILTQKVKGDLKKLQAGRTPLTRPVKPPLIQPLSKLKPLTPIKSPLLKSSEPKQPVKLPVLKLPDLISNKKEKLKVVPNSPLVQPIKPPNPNKKGEPLLKSSNPTLDKIRAALQAAKSKEAPINKIIPVTTPKPVLSPLEKLRVRLYEKYNLPNDGKDHGDILGKTLAQFPNKNPDDVGTAQNSGKIEPVPVPVLTKEMRTPFMGLATKQDLEQYFKKLYCANCKMADIK